MTAPDKHRILIVDDESVNRKVLAALLDDDHDIILAKNGDQALDRLGTDNSIDLVLLDVMMPDMDGYEVLTRIKQMEGVQDLPVIFISALNSLDNEERGLHLGAADYISKPFHPAIVKLRVENHLRFIRQRKLLEKLAGRDGLTEIANRRKFDKTLESEWKRSSRENHPLSLAIVDVDFFKNFNDTHGHANGDRVLKALATTMSINTNRPSDLVARYGGEEFGLIFPATDAAGAESLLESLRQAIEDMNIEHHSSDASKWITISVGGATLIASEDNTPGDLVDLADKQLYRAKSEGRNRVCWA